MNREKWIATVQKDAEAKGVKISKADCTVVLNAALEAIRDEVKIGNKVGLIGFGSFRKDEKNAKDVDFNASSTFFD